MMLVLKQLDSDTNILYISSVKEVIPMSTVYQTNPKTGVTYAYSTVSYWDKEAKRPRNKREYLGRVDPITKAIIPKESHGKNDASREAGPNDADDLKAVVKRQNRELEQKDRQIAKLQEDLTALQQRYRAASELLHEIAKTISSSAF